MEILTTEGIILNTLPYGDYDVIATVFSRDHGIIKLFIKSALKNEIHVVTSNKGPLALYFNELHLLSNEYGVELQYESTVGSGIPIISLGMKNLGGNKIKSILAILNNILKR